MENNIWIFIGGSSEVFGYWQERDRFWIGNNLAYEKGKFAKLLDKKN